MCKYYTIEDKVEGGLLLDVVVQRDTSVFELFASEDEALLVWWNAVWHVKLTFIVVVAGLRTCEIFQSVVITN